MISLPNGWIWYGIWVGGVSEGLPQTSLQRKNKFFSPQGAEQVSGKAICDFLTKYSSKSSQTSRQANNEFVSTATTNFIRPPPTQDLLGLSLRFY